jgi:hypothetical protein
MTSTTKRLIAREWLIFLVCVVTGFFVAYYALYFNERVYMGYTASAGELFKYKNPGDMFHDLISDHARILTLHLRPLGISDRSTLWLYVLSPYFVLWFVRSIIWSVNMVRRH